MTDEVEPIEETGDEMEFAIEGDEVKTLCLAEGNCIVFNRDLFLYELDNPALMTMDTKGHLFLYWYSEDDGWTFAEIKGKERVKNPPATVRAIR